MFRSLPHVCTFIHITSYITIDHWQSCLCLSIVSWGHDSLLTSANNPYNQLSPIFVDFWGLPVAPALLACFRQKELETGSEIIHLFWIVWVGYSKGLNVSGKKNKAHTMHTHKETISALAREHKKGMNNVWLSSHIYCQSCSDHAARSCEAVPQPAGST